MPPQLMACRQQPIRSQAILTPPDHSKRVERVSDLALDIATPFFELAETVLEAIPIPGLPYVARGILIIVERVKDSRANEETRRVFNDRVMALDAVIKETFMRTRAAIESYEGDGFDKDSLLKSIIRSEELQARMQALLDTIGTLRESSKDLRGGKGLRGAFNSVIYASRNEAILSDMQNALKGAVLVFKIRSNISVELMVNEVVRETRMLRDTLREAEEQRILNSITHPPAGYRSVDELKSQFMEGTREELFEDIDSWADSDFSEAYRVPFFLLCGPAGLGKSSVAHQFCTRLDNAENTRLGASFFFVRGHGELDSAQAFPSALAYQLAQTQPALRPLIIAAIQQHSTRGKEQQLQYTFEDLLRKPLAQVETEARRPIILVLDGLDECKDRHLLPRLLESMLELVRLAPWIRVFATTRPEPHILAVFLSPKFQAFVHIHNMNDTFEDWDNDVRHYLEKTVPKIPPYDTFIRSNRHLFEQLIRRAGGVFIYARVAVTFLEMYRDRPEEQFQLLLETGGAGIAPLDALYLQVLRSAFPPEDLHTSPLRLKRLRSFLTFIALQIEPTTPGAISLLSPGLSKDDVVAMVDRLRSIVLINWDGCVQPLHATFGEFLLDEERCNDRLYHVNRSEGQTRLANACMSSFTFQNLTNCLKAGRDSDEGRHIFYAKRSWDVHLKEAEFSDVLLAQVKDLMHAMPAYFAVYPVFTEEITENLEHFLQPHVTPAEASDMCIEYSKLAAFSREWWTQIRRYSGLDPMVTLQDVSAHQNLHSKLFRDPSLDCEPRIGDVRRYQTAHESFMRKLEAAGVKELWISH